MSEALVLGLPNIELPSIPEYLKDPMVFMDVNLGIVMAAMWGYDLWLFTKHRDHWCSERKATEADLHSVEELRRAAGKGRK